eukprot:IDg14084t1
MQSLWNQCGLSWHLREHGQTICSYSSGSAEPTNVESFTESGKESCAADYLEEFHF